MTDFKIGDQVRCIDDSDQDGDPIHVRNGEIYTVAEVYASPFSRRTLIRLAETGDFGWCPDRFEQAHACGDLLGQALTRKPDEPTKPAYEPETFVGKPIDWSKLIKDSST